MGEGSCGLDLRLVGNDEGGGHGAGASEKSSGRQAGVHWQRSRGVS